MKKIGIKQILNKISLKGEDPKMFHFNPIKRSQDNYELLNRDVLYSQSEFYGGL